MIFIFHNAIKTLRLLKIVCMNPEAAFLVAA